MAYFTFMQASDNNGRWPSERFLCVEADSADHAFERAAWYGADLTARVRGYLLWDTHGPGWNTTYPKLSSHRLENTTHPGGWVILYKNNNMKSSMANNDEVGEPEPPPAPPRSFTQVWDEWGGAVAHHFEDPYDPYDFDNLDL